MRISTAALIITIFACIPWSWACEGDQAQNGCKIYGSSCSCGYGCKTEYIYRTKRSCLNALRDRSSNVCHRAPCLRGTCIQTAQDPGFTCKCEGTGFYGQRCEKDNTLCGDGDEYHHSNSSCGGVKVVRVKVYQSTGSSVSLRTITPYCDRQPACQAWHIPPNDPGDPWGRCCPAVDDLRLKRCPTVPMRGMVFPHECVVI